MKARLVALVAILGGAALGGVGALACSSPGSGDGTSPRVAPESVRAPSGSAPGAASPPSQPNYSAGPPDLSASVVQRGARVAVARPFGSLPLRELPDAVPVEDRFEHEPGANPFPFAAHPEPDPVLQSALPLASMPVAVQSFLGQGATLGGCVFPRPDAGEPANCTTVGDPPDTVGAVGPNHYVQIVNSGVAVWKKDGTLLVSPKFTSSIFTGMPTTDGNHCGSPPRPNPPGGDWGDGVVLYDQMADRWVITQFDLTNYANSNTGPSYQCVAVSKTGDPSGAYWLYDFQYSVQINDYGKFSVWPDGYYASYNDFNPGFTSANLCAWDRASMLAGKPATQQCFTNSGFGFLPASVDGSVKPPSGEPAFFVNLRSGTSIGLYKFHVDWTTPGNSTFTGPTALTVASYNKLCAAGNCVVQPSPGNPLASLGDRPMFHLSYRNFGTLESLVFNHSVAAGTAGGIRWYEIRSPNGTPVVFQQGTYAPADGNYRWMGSIAQDQAQDMALGYTLSGSATFPSIAWSGRVATDPAGTMGQAEAVVQAGTGVEDGNFSDGTPAERWGDYSNMTVDPTDDCTFWYTQELYAATGTFNWDTHVSSVTFPSCAKNDFTIGISPASQSLPEGGKATYTVTTAVARGTAETVALNIQDLPAGVTAAFVPASVTAGTASTLTLSATLAAPLTATPDTFTVIGKATSAVHPAAAEVTVTACAKITSCPSPDNCGTISDGCGGTVSCGSTTCAPLDACHTAGTCTGNVCSNPVAVNGTACNDGSACTTADACANGTCTGTPVVCANGDQCNDPGTCAPATGVCSAPVPKAGAVACTDNNGCTTGDVCTNGACVGAPVVCTNGDACHDPGTCQGDAGVCSAPTAKSDGTACSGTDRCTQSYTCQAGACTAGNPVVCTAQDECHDVGTCSSADGACSNPPKGDGTPCSIGTCRGGTCTAPGPNDAGPSSDAGPALDGSSGTPADAGSAVADSGAGADGGATGAPPGQSGGCGCRTVPAREGSPLALAGIGMALAVAGVRRRRRGRG